MCFCSLKFFDTHCITQLLLLQAIALDDSGTFKNRLEHALKRVKLKALLYEEPERAEEHAAMIIEQVCSSLRFYMFIL